MIRGYRLVLVIYSGDRASSSFSTFGRLRIVPLLAVPFVFLVVVYAFFLRSCKLVLRMEKKDAREREERVRRRQRTYREREDGEKKPISNTMPKRTRRPF